MRCQLTGSGRSVLPLICWNHPRNLLFRSSGLTACGLRRGTTCMSTLLLPPHPPFTLDLRSCHMSDLWTIEIVATLLDDHLAQDRRLINRKKPQLTDGTLSSICLLSYHPSLLLLD
jgi:hypothetical protein